MLGYGYERDLGLGYRLLRGSKQNCGCVCRPVQWKKSCGCWFRSLQGKNLMWASPLNLRKQTRTLNLK
jgi:hypothetical protein